MLSPLPANISPLCVALEGCLIRTNLLHEGLLALVKSNALYVFKIIVWIRRGRAVLETEVAARTEINAASLPYDEELLDWLRSERFKGRPIWLFSTGGERYAGAVAAHLGIFERVLAAERGVYDHLVAQFEAHRPTRSDRLRPLLRSLRPHQWAKNMLIFVPILAAHRLGALPDVTHVILGFVAFCLCASAVYVLNDMLDLEADRQHARKRLRPFASGALPLSLGFVMIPSLLCPAIVIAALLDWKFAATLGAYLVLTLAYSLGLKRLVIIDINVLAGLYTLRVIAGAVASNTPLSFWLLFFSAFFFLSLALIKRYAELDSLRLRNQSRAAGRGYDVTDLPMLEALGIAGGYLSILILGLYINSPGVTVSYTRPAFLWPLCALAAYWMSRMWMKTHRGRMHDDPVVFALRDRVSLAIGALCALCVWIAI
jgi:4-hydroxybenzoate polyprenyltransferase